jgi:hypothetical protein
MICDHMRHECRTSQGRLSRSPWKSVCHDEELQMPQATVCQAVKYLSSYSELVDLCVWILFRWYQKMNVSYMVVFGDEGTFELTTEMLSREAGPIRWHGMSCESTLLDIFWSNVTQHVCTGPFDILLMERHTEIDTRFETCSLLGFYAA